jgi:hypothetical protein
MREAPEKEVRQITRVPSARFAYNSLEAGFIDRKFEIWRVPSSDAVSVEVDNGHFDVWTFDGDDGASWTACEYRWSRRLWSRALDSSPT